MRHPPMLPPATTPVLVQDPETLRALVESLRREMAIALDTESNSFHVYQERVCLLQISTRTHDYIVDPLAVNPSPLGAVLCDGRDTVLHGADYDVRCLQREYGWRLPRLFDTMAAARRLGRPGLGLSALVEAHFGVRLSKAFQRADWGHRPLTRDQLAYASRDTHYLLPLYDLLSAELSARAAMDDARREFERIAAAKFRERTFDPEAWRRLKGARDLDAAGRAVLRALWIAREGQARALDRPPFKVLGEEVMVAIARLRPSTDEELLQIAGISPSVLRRMGALVRDAVAGGRREPGAAA
jgi:ribonuclease D